MHIMQLGAVVYDLNDKIQPIFIIWISFLVTWLELTRFTRLTQPSQGQKAKPRKLTLAVLYFSGNLKRAWTFSKIKNPPSAAICRENLSSCSADSVSSVDSVILARFAGGRGMVIQIAGSTHGYRS